MSAVISAPKDGLVGHCYLMSQSIVGLFIVSLDDTLTTTPLHTLMLSHDPIIGGLRGQEQSFYLGLVPLPLAADGVIRQTLSSKPKTTPYNGSADFSRYGSSIHTLFSVPEILAGQPRAPQPSLIREKETRHYNWSGSGCVTDFTVPRHGSIGSFALWGSGTTVQCHRFGEPIASIYNPYTQQFGSGGGFGGDIGSILKYVSSVGQISRSQVGSNSCFFAVTDYEETSDFLDADCELSFYIHSRDAIYTIAYNLFLSKKMVNENIRSQVYSGDYLLWRTSHLPRITFKGYSCTDCEIPVTTDINSLFSPNLILVQTTADRVILGDNAAYEHSRRRRSVLKESSRFFGEINSSYSDLLSASNFSAADALQAIEGGVSNNLLQTVVKLPSISSALPQIREAVQLLGHIVKRDLSLATLKEILDLASSTTLQASFQWRPMLEILTTHLPVIHNLAKDCSHGKKVTAGRGKWKYTFLDGELSRPAQLTARTKIVLDESPRGLLAALLTVDAFGLFPKPSNIWDLLPFSFVVNWITGVGNGIRRAEYSAVLLGMPAYYVHSYEVKSPFKPEELENWSLSSEFSDPLSMKVVFRDISLYAPLPRQTRFGFGLPTSSPPLGVVLALLYQLFIR